MKRAILLLALAGVLAVVGWLAFRRAQPPQVNFVKAQRETLVSLLSTNGKVEPMDWVAVRAETSGLVERVPIQRGQNVNKGAVIAVMDAQSARAELAAAESRLAQARAELEVFHRGGRAAEIAEIEGNLANLRQQREVSLREVETLRKLAEKNAATRYDVTQAQDRVSKLDTEIASLTARRGALVNQGDKTAIEARIRDAQAALDLARTRMSQAEIRSPRGGVVYNLPARVGAYLNPGDLVAEVGRLDQVRILLYIDEPELGRVAKGMPVEVTWDAMPGKTWSGEIERTASQITALGTRQVGEVSMIADNPGLELRPGANVNANVRAQVVENALTVPKEALRRENGKFGVYVLEGGKVDWREVEVGASNITRTEIRRGLSGGESVALPGERLLRTGMQVTPAELPK